MELDLIHQMGQENDMSADAIEEDEQAPGATSATTALGAQDTVMQSSRCLLCDLTLHRDHSELSALVSSFIADHVTRTQVAKIAEDVLEVLRENLPASFVGDTTAQDIIVHIQTHTTNPRVIMTQVVRDLMDLASVAHETCILTCQETNRKMINPRAASVYLKTVGELQGALRHEALRVQK